MKPTFSFALLALAASCGKVGLDRPADDAPDAGGAANRLPRAANTDGAPAVDAPRDAPEDAPAPPLAATILRVTNVGATAFTLHLQFAAVCPYGFWIQGGAPFDRLTSLGVPDTVCDCGTCAASSNAPPRCEFTDFICDDATVVIPPGAHVDTTWDRTVLVWLSPPPATSQCVGFCTAFVSVPAGSYTFILEQPVREFTVQAQLPAAGGIVEIPVSAP